MIWNYVDDKLKLDCRLYFILVVESIGSSPGKVGFKMAVSSDGTINGSIGGGVMEYQMVELARKKLTEPRIIPFLKRQVHTHDAPEDKSGMICSGEQMHIFLPVTKNDSSTISTILNTLNTGNKGILKVDENGFSFIPSQNDSFTAPTFINENNKWSYTEYLGYKDSVYIFGAGHISLPLSQILGLLDFRVEVFDNRKELSTYETNNFAHCKRVIDFKNAATFVPEGENNYVVIMTFGHKFDETILRQFLPKKLKYLGMIGSKSKVKTIFENLIKEEYSPEQVNRVFSPIGLSINSITPAEIAISIAAQIVQQKNS